MKPPTDPTTASQPAPVVRTSPAAVRALRAAREGTASPSRQYAIRWRNPHRTNRWLATVKPETWTANPAESLAFDTREAANVVAAGWVSGAVGVVIRPVTKEGAL